jgi:hypothetical protein
MRLPLDAILLTAGTQQRTSINEAAVSEYADVYMAGGTLPQPVVFFDGTDYILAGGFHRYHAARQAGLSELVVDLRQGTRREAVLYAVGDNATHGLRRSHEDKRKAVRTLLEDAEWGQWADREIARQCHVGYTLVAKLREELKSHLPARADSESEARTVKRGEQVYEQKVKAAKEPMPVPMPAAKPGKTAPADEPDPEAADKLATALEVAEDAQKQCVVLAAEIKALTADDQCKETQRWVRLYESAQRRQADIQRTLVDREAELQRQSRTIQRICKAVGEPDPIKVAAKVEQLMRDRKGVPA